MKLDRLKYLIAARYVRSPKSHSVINIISGVSIVAMAMPVAAIILLLSIFNGLERMTYEFYNAKDADLRILPLTGTTMPIAQIDSLALAQVEGVATLSYVLEQNALAVADGRSSLVTLRGVDTHFPRVVDIKQQLLMGSFTTSLDEADCIVASAGVAHDLAMRNQGSLGKSISLYAINRQRISSLLPVGGYTRCDMPMTGIFAIDQESNSLLYTSLRAAQKLFSYPGRISSIELRLSPGANTDQVKRQLSALVEGRCKVLTRYESNSIYRLMALEKWGVFFIAMIVMAVASLSVVGTLIMVIIDKRDDIATLRTLGAKQSLIEGIFLSEGQLMALLSLALGLALGIVLTLVQQHLGVVRLNASSLLVDAYPIELQLGDVVLTTLAYALISWAIIRLTVRRTLLPKTK